MICQRLMRLAAVDPMHRLKSVAIGLVAAGMLAAPALAGAAPNVMVDGGSHAPSRTQKSLVFECDGQRYAIALDMHPARQDVRLVRLDVAGRALSSGDRAKVQAALDRFFVVYEIGLRCGDKDDFYINGPPRFSGTTPAAGNLGLVLRFNDGHLVSVIE
ncbi:MAG: hypothetical protein WDM86_03235 [Rhizomicrobium sp.]